mgnify:FL=1
MPFTYFAMPELEREKLTTMINCDQYATPLFVVLVFIGGKMLLVDSCKRQIGVTLLPNVMQGPA